MEMSYCATFYQVIKREEEEFSSIFKMDDESIGDWTHWSDEYIKCPNNLSLSKEHNTVSFSPLNRNEILLACSTYPIARTEKSIAKYPFSFRNEPFKPSFYPPLAMKKVKSNNYFLGSFR